MANLVETWRKLGQLWIWWTVGTTTAGAAVYLLAVMIGSLNGGELPQLFWIGIPAGAAAAGLAAGVFQRRALRPFVPVTARWVWATALGLAVCIPLLVGVSGWLSGLSLDWPAPYRLTLFLLNAGVTGALSGLGQWLLLRDKIARALWWLLACAVGWLLAWLAVLALWWVLGQGADLPATLADFAAVIILGAAAGWMLGVEQGIALVGLIAQREWEAREPGRQIPRF